MKKRDFIFAGLILLAAPMSAQNGPVRTDQDSKLVFEQTFEADFDAWSKQLVDTINGVYYYKNNTTAQSNAAISSPWDTTKTEWHSGFLRRDTLINLYNGVVQTDSQADMDSLAFAGDAYTIVTDAAGDFTRNQALAEFGVDGGKKFFRYSAGDGHKAASYSSGLVPEYRRNLFVRGLPIEDNTSYRLTVYVKTTKLAGTTPTFRADVMRGYFASEKPFTMGLENDSKNYKYNTEFTFEKNNFVNDEWTKIVFMTYYLNDSIADNYMLSNGYWWTDEWKWRNTGVADYDSLAFIRQPDKFFARLSFRSDSTVFDVDNLSLTKSWIGGVEHSGDMIRVDFGYQTNLNEKAQAAFDKNKIAAVELPGQYFEVWGMDSATHRWTKVDIASAEYQGDGYMYMWTKPRNNRPVKFDSYDSVLVSFINPDDPALTLNYNGSKFPKALDVDWIKAGKKVPDFHNELSIKNPNIGKGVVSMKNLPPVLQECGYEEGSFNLDGNLREFAFKFSRKVEYDVNADESTNLALMQLYQDGVKKETWFVKGYGVNDSILVFARPASYNAPLSGDYEFRLLQLKGQSTEYGNNSQPVIVNYSFGLSTMPQDLTYSDFAGEATASSFTTQSCAIAGFSSDRCATKVTEFKGAYAKALMFGIFSNNTGANNNENECAKLFYSFSIPEDGDYDIIWGMTGCEKQSYNDDCDIIAELYTADDDETDIKKEYGPTGFEPDEGGRVDAVKIDTLHCTELEAGDYKVAFKLFREGSYGGSHKGGKVLYFIYVIKKGDVLPSSYPYLKALDSALKGLNALIEKADADAQYKGADYNAAKAVYAKYVDFIDTKPSLYISVTSYINTATAGYQVRFNVIDSLLTTAKDAAQSTYTLYTEGEKAAFKDWDDVKFIGAALDELKTIKCENFTNDQLRNKTNYIFAKIADLKLNAGLNQFAPGQILALKALADSLGVDFGADKDAIAARVERAKLLSEPDADLVSIYKKAITAKIYDRLATDINDPKLDSLVMTAYIQNPGMYVTATLDKVEWFNYTYGGATNRWRLQGDIDHTEVMPGWTVRSTKSWGTNTNVHLGSEQRQWNDPAHNGDANADAVFDGSLSVDWNSSVTVKGEISEIPAGMYDLGLNIQSGVAGSYIQGTSGSSVRKYEFASGSNGNQATDSIMVSSDTIQVEMKINSGSGWSYADDFYLIFYPDKTASYATLKTAAAQALSDALTFVAGTKAEKAKVEYYNINGVKVDAPAKGAVNIKVTTLSDGTRVVQKVLVK